MRNVRVADASARRPYPVSAPLPLFTRSLSHFVVRTSCRRCRSHSLRLPWPFLACPYSLPAVVVRGLRRRQLVCHASFISCFFSRQVTSSGVRHKASRPLDFMSAYADLLGLSSTYGVALQLFLICSHSHTTILYGFTFSLSFCDEPRTPARHAIGTSC